MHYKQHNKYDLTQRERNGDGKGGWGWGWGTKSKRERNRECERGQKKWYVQKEHFNLSPFFNCQDRQNISGEYFKSNMIDAHITTLKSLKQHRIGGQDVQQKATLILKHLHRQWGHQRLQRWLGQVRPPVLYSMGLGANAELSIMKIDLNWDLWLLNGWHWGIFLSREWRSQYGTYKRPINNVRVAYKTFTDWVKALYSASSAPRYAWEYCEKNYVHLFEDVIKLSPTRRAFSTFVPISLLTQTYGSCKVLFTETLLQCVPTSSLMLEWFDHRMIMSEQPIECITFYMTATYFVSKS